jgi:hypothetical protein
MSGSASALATSSSSSTGRRSPTIPVRPSSAGRKRPPSPSPPSGSPVRALPIGHARAASTASVGSVGGDDQPLSRYARLAWRRPTGCVLTDSLCVVCGVRARWSVVRSGQLEEMVLIQHTEMERLTAENSALRARHVELKAQVHDILRVNESVAGELESVRALSQSIDRTKSQVERNIRDVNHIIAYGTARTALHCTQPRPSHSLSRPLALLLTTEVVAVRCCAGHPPVREAAAVPLRRLLLHRRPPRRLTTNRPLWHRTMRGSVRRSPPPSTPLLTAPSAAVACAELWC